MLHKIKEFEEDWLQILQRLDDTHSYYLFEINWRGNRRIKSLKLTKIFLGTLKFFCLFKNATNYFVNTTNAMNVMNTENH